MADSDDDIKSRAEVEEITLGFNKRLRVLTNYCLKKKMPMEAFADFMFAGTAGVIMGTLSDREATRDLLMKSLEDVMKGVNIVGERRGIK